MLAACDTDCLTGVGADHLVDGGEVKGIEPGSAVEHRGSARVQRPTRGLRLASRRGRHVSCNAVPHSITLKSFGRQSVLFKSFRMCRSAVLLLGGTMLAAAVFAQNNPQTSGSRSQ